MIRTPTVLLGISVALALLAAILTWRSEGQGGGFRMDGRAAAPLGGPFTLVDQSGHVRTDRDFRGRWVLVYFGYTSCPDVCPTTLEEIADALHRMGPQAARVAPLFVTLDPERDRPAILAKYVAAFGPEFVGLTGTTAQVAAVAHAYRVYYEKRPLPGGGYSVDHASTIYLMAPDGRFEAILDAQDGAAAMAKDLSSRL